MPDEIIISRTIPTAFASGQTLRLPNGKTIVLLSPSYEISNLCMQLEHYKDKIMGFFNPKRLKRTSVQEQPVQEYLTTSSGILGWVNLKS